MASMQEYIDELRRRAGVFTSLDNSDESDLADAGIDFAAGFAPGIGTALALRDFERARRDDDKLGMLLSGIGATPGVGGIARGVNMTRMADKMTAAEKAWATRMAKVARNKGVQHREALRNGETIVEEVTPPPARVIISPEELYGKVGVQVQGDRSRANSVVRALRGIPLEGGVKLEGGPQYAQLALENNPGGAWASMRGAAQGKQNQFNRAAELTGREPIGVYSAMSSDGVNFSTPVAEAMIKQLRVLKPNKNAVVTADREIKRLAPEFVGLQSQEALDQLLGRGGFPMEGAGQVRKALVDTLRKAEYEYQGFPVYDDIIDAITETDLKSSPLGASGYTAFRAIPNAKLIEKGSVKTPHASYDTVIPGEYIGGLQKSVPPEIMFPKIYERQRALGRNPFRIHRSLQTNNQDFEEFDQQWLDNIMSYLRKSGE
jgi:hypothetical protein